MKGPGFVEQGCWDLRGLSEGRAVDAASPGGCWGRRASSGGYERAAIVGECDLRRENMGAEGRPVHLQFLKFSVLRTQFLSKPLFYNSLEPCIQ